MEWLLSWEVTSVVVGIIIAIGLGVLALDDFKLAKLFFLLAAADATGGIVMWSVKTDVASWMRNVIIFCAVGAIGVIVSQSLRYVGRKETQKKSKSEPSTPLPPTADTAIFMESEIAALPITVLRHSKINVVPLNKRTIQASNWGIFVVPNDSDRDQKWPDKHTMVTARTAHNPGIWAWRCTLTNHGPTNLLSAAVPIRIWFGNEKPELVHTVIASPLDSGKDFTFYLVNDCHELVNAVWPDTATVQIFGESHPRSVPLRRTYKTPIDQIMIFFGSTTRLIGGEPCE
jgi:hypothetical protein